MFIKELAKYGSHMGIIAKNTEDYISFSVNIEVGKHIDKVGEERSKEISLRFIDSIKFMSGSLDSLVNNLVHGGGELFGFEDYNDSQSCSLERESTHMNVWTIGIDSKKQPFLLREPSIVSSTCLELMIKIMNMPAGFGETLGLGTWEDTTIYI